MISYFLVILLIILSVGFPLTPALSPIGRGGKEDKDFYLFFSYPCEINNLKITNYGFIFYIL